MKVIIPAGGLGTRARPFTDYSPKPMIPIDDRPTIDYVVRYLAKQPEIDEIVIVCNLEVGHGRQIKNYFEGKEGVLGKKIDYVEDRYEGTGGALLRASGKLQGQEFFLVWFSDNLCPLDVKDMLRYYLEKGGVGCIAVSGFKREETGFVKIGSNGLILKFREKPLIKLKEPECLAIYLFNIKILDYISKVKEVKDNVNLSYDVLQKLPAYEKLYAYDVKDLPWIDIESPAKVERNHEYIKRILSLMEGRCRS